MNPSIFAYERRDVIARMNRASRAHATLRLLSVLLLAGLLAAWAIQNVYPAISAAPVLTPVVYADGREGDLTTLCAQYRSDKLLTGDTMEGETAILCGFSN